jgi:hypothetical protein
VSKVGIAGWILLTVGTALWIFGYFVAGNPSFIDWHAHTPWWIADYLPNAESEIGMVLAFVGSALTYWPTHKQ